MALNAVDGMLARESESTGITSLTWEVAEDPFFDDIVSSGSVDATPDTDGTVTVVADACTLDWVLVAAGGFEDAEPDFDAWIASFRLPDAPELAGAES